MRRGSQFIIRSQCAVVCRYVGNGRPHQSIPIGRERYSSRCPYVVWNQYLVTGPGADAGDYIVPTIADKLRYLRSQWHTRGGRLRGRGFSRGSAGPLRFLGGDAGPQRGPDFRIGARRRVRRVGGLDIARRVRRGRGHCFQRSEFGWRRGIAQPPDGGSRRCRRHLAGRGWRSRRPAGQRNGDRHPRKDQHRNEGCAGSAAQHSRHSLIPILSCASPSAGGWRQNKGAAR